MVYLLLDHLELQDQTVRTELMVNPVYLARTGLMDHHLLLLPNMNSVSTALKVPWDHLEIRDQRDLLVILGPMDSLEHLDKQELLELRAHLDPLETMDNQEVLALQELLDNSMKFLARTAHLAHQDLQDLLDLMDNLEWMDNLGSQDHKDRLEIMEQQERLGSLELMEKMDRMERPDQQEDATTAHLHVPLQVIRPRAQKFTQRFVPQNLFIMLCSE